jgi:hypothetical protein
VEDSEFRTHDCVLATSTDWTEDEYVGLGRSTDEEIVLVFDPVVAPVDRVRYRYKH